MKNLYLVLFFLLTFNFALFSQEGCTVEAGTLPNETQYICVGGAIPLQSEGVVLGEQDALIYLVHTTSNLIESMIIDTILTDSLTWNRHENELIDFNSKYFVSAVAGLDENANGVPDDLAHECTVVSESMLVVWTAPIEFTYDVDCYGNGYFDGMLCDFRGMEGVLTGQISNIGENIGNLERTFIITIDSGTFEIGSEGEFSVSVDDEAIASWYFEVNIQDNWGCLDTTINAEDVAYCHPSNYTDIQTLTGMPIEQQIICPNDTTDIEASCVYRLGVFGIPPVDYAVLPTPEYGENAIIAVSEDRGLFTHQDVAGLWNTELYVFATALGRPLFGGDLQLFISKYPTPVVFLSPFDIDLQIEDCGSNTAQITLSPIGGYSSYNQSDKDKYFISSEIFEGELTLGETTMIEWAIPPMEMDSMIIFQVSDSYGCVQSIEVGNPCLSVNIAPLNPTSFSLKTVSPIPTKDRLYLQIHSQTTQNLQLQLIDIGGKQILIQDKPIQLGENHLQWDIGGVTTGMYYLQLTTREGSLFKKIILE